MVVSRTELAVSVTVGFAGTVAGAIYVTAVLVCPESAPQPGAQALPAWVRAQVTPWFTRSLTTLAVNCCAFDTFSDALVGEIVTDTGAVMVIVAFADLLVFETEVAVNVTVAGFGTLLGAV